MPKKLPSKLTENTKAESAEVDKRYSWEEADEKFQAIVRELRRQVANNESRENKLIVDLILNGKVPEEFKGMTEDKLLHRVGNDIQNRARRIAAAMKNGRQQPEVREFDELLERYSKRIDQFSEPGVMAANALHAEAKDLYAALDGMDLYRAISYLVEHPTHPAIVAYIIVVTRHDTRLRFKSEEARANANKRQIPIKQARVFVQQEWLLHQSAYHHNKSSFARDYARRVKNEYSVDITEKTIRERWLKST